ncbi:hypothetical protein CONCODRAFT_8172 [Conidiobolus coronatus NRRL 28638]|uniref:Uncharacterized protein n=1 Tax=Conidiobolus coronatus (strain ATCC 28846 / CBS 209.66 / NRRL 28638) TaxID=796925 RepID=A0A137P3F2_CONC2|nr:hypothetical protein CONCODRAFT_8172 [Conidiobolus coronatus NRRL 28638]|eukprot:KXN69434.1 hypothetical protein CONCODRAFT_8172 [Conidiobolus coronatus NRRL 28638]
MIIINTTASIFFFNIVYLTLLATLALSNLISSFKNRLEGSSISNISISAISLILIVFYIGFCIWFRNRCFNEEAKRKFLENSEIKSIEVKSKNKTRYGENNSEVSAFKL